MIYGSVCSGIESAAVAWHPLGWEAKWFAEIDPFCDAVLKRHYPKIPNRGDIQNVQEKDGTINLLVGGTPCQAFSVNGQRKGLDDPRGMLTLQYIRILQTFRPWWFVWENVPGTLSIDGGRIFKRFIKAIIECGYGIAWRVVDLRFFGVPQRRRRLFVVGRLGKFGIAKAAAVLFDRKANQKNPVPVEEIREVGSIFGWTGDETPKFGFEVSPTLRSGQGGEGAGYTNGTEWSKFTPREWERLNGLPDDYTLVEFKGKPASDKMRMHAVGNSYPVPILSWIGQRIDFIQREGL